MKISILVLSQFLLFSLFAIQAQTNSAAPATQTVDVTDMVKAAISNNALSYTVSNDNLGDPAPTLQKKLKVEYTIDGVASSKIALEGGTITVKPADGQKLEITKATYGVIPENYIDVTDVLGKAVKANKLSINIDNDTLGGDPYPTQQKEIHVSYTLDGKALNATASEGDTLVLPASGTGVLVIVKADYGGF